MQAKQSKNRKNREDDRRSKAYWILTIFFLTLCISALFSFLSSVILGSVSIVAAFFVLLAIIFIGIMFDTIGVAVTAADEKPFHSMAAKKTKGAREALQLLRKADRVSSVCNDVIGDVCGIISGSASAVIVAKLLFPKPTIASLVISALVAALTVGGKAFGKSIAIHQATKIVHWAALSIYYFKKAFPLGKRSKR